MKILRFIRNVFVDETNTNHNVCVVGALARVSGMSIRNLVSRGIVGTVRRVSKKLKIKEKDLRRLMDLNDSEHWEKLTDKLKRLELYHLVKRFALNVKYSRPQKNIKKIPTSFYVEI